MASTTDNMQLVTWDQIADLYNYTTFTNNWQKVDAHDHTTPNRGVQIPTGGIADEAITTAKLAAGSVGTDQLIANAITTAKLAASSVTTSKIASGTIESSNIAAGTLLTSVMAPGVVRWQSAPTALPVDGQFRIAAPGESVTLPSAIVGTMVGVFASSTVTGASPVTVHAGGGAIYGVGLSGATSFLLGTADAFTVLWCFSAGQWGIIAGEADTGWVTLPPSSGAWSTVGQTILPSCRLRGDLVELKGSYGIITGTGQLTTLPASCRPIEQLTLPAASDEVSAPALLIIAVNGAITVEGAVSALELHLDSISYSLS
jgi:hypothetical protein